MELLSFQQMLNRSCKFGVKVGIYLLLLLQGGCVYDLHERYAYDDDQYHLLTSFDMQDSTFVMTFWNMGEDSIFGFFERKRNNLKLTPSYSKVSTKNAVFCEDSVRIWFGLRPGHIPLPAVTLDINNIQTELDSLGSVFFPLEYGDSTTIAVSGDFVLPGEVKISNQGEIAYQVSLDYQKNQIPEAYMYKIRKDRIVPKNGFTRYSIQENGN
jgi:hypothetical protein